MPYLTNQDRPRPVRLHLPAPAQDIYRKAFNHAYEQYRFDHEEISHRVAWSAVKRKFEKIGGQWLPRLPQLRQERKTT
jgi:cation transport regulator